MDSPRRTQLTGMSNVLPTTKASLLVLIAFTIWYSEDYLLFANPRITMASFSPLSDAPIPPNVIGMFITFCGFLLLFTLYKKRLFAICEGYGLVASSAMTTLGAVILYVSWPLDSPIALSVIGFSLITFGHQCFLPEMVKHLACLGTSRAMSVFAATLLLLLLLKIAFAAMPAEGLLVYLAIATLIMLACVRMADKAHEHMVVMRKDAKERIPRTLMFMQIAVGVLVGMHLSLVKFSPMSSLAPEAIGLIAAAVVTLLVVIFAKVNFNKMFFEISLPIMSLGLIVISGMQIVPCAIGEVVYTFGFFLFFATLWTLYSYLVRYASFNYYWLPVSAAIGSFAGRVLGVFGFSCAESFIGPTSSMTFYTPLVTAIVLIACIRLCSRNNMRDGWGSITPGNQEFILDSFERNCATIAEQAKLSSREADVLQLLARGRNRKHISEALFISEGTAKTHVKHVYRKLGVHTQQELIDLVEKARQYNDE